MSSLAQVLKNWDWDKLQEKRSRQSGYTPPPEDNTGNDEDDHSEKRRPFRPFGGGNGGGSRNGGDNGPAAAEYSLSPASSFCSGLPPASTSSILTRKA